MIKPIKKTLYLYILFAIFLFAGLILSILMGSSKLSLLEIISALSFKKGFETQSIIVYNLRLPRVLGAIIAGSGLAISGAILQTITNNKLCGPNVIGVNAGAGFAVVLMSVIMPISFYFTPVFAFLGAFLTTIIIVILAGKINGRKSTIILAGIAITALFNALISFLTILDDNISLNYRYFSVGGLYGITLEQLIIPFIIVVLSLFVVVIMQNKIDALSLNDTTAISLGVNAKKVRFIALIIASASAAAAVSFAGLLGFVGLAVPHIAKKLVGVKTKDLVPTSALVGATLLVYADLLSRVIFSKTEIPLGIITAFLGAPFFFILLLRGRDDA